MKKLKIKIVFSAFISTFLIMVIIFFVFFAYFYSMTIEVLDPYADVICGNKGDLPSYEEWEKQYTNGVIPSLDENLIYTLRYFVVVLDKDYKVKTLNTDNISGVSDKDAMEITQKALSRKNDRGLCDKYRYKLAKNGDGYIVVFINCKDDIGWLKLYLLVFAAIAFAITLLVTILFAVFSKMAIRPFEINMQKQKRFITDASHELKTPLAIIASNAEVLQYKSGENKWITNIIDQIKHMRNMINDLLVLTRLEEVDYKIVFENADIILLLNMVLEEFSQSFENKKVTVKKNIPDTLFMGINPDMIKQMLTIIVENASKYVVEQGELDVSVKQERRFVTISIGNTANIPDDLNTENLFDRFYRPDASRNSSIGGHGIGLSIAQTIANNHGGAIKAVKKGDKLYFDMRIEKKAVSGRKKSAAAASAK